jgi:hypothetical protein
MDFECSFCEALHWLGERKSDSSRLNPKFYSCCKSSAVRLPSIRDPPAKLQRLFTSPDQNAVQFRQGIRHYNGAFAFTFAVYNVAIRVQGGFNPFQTHGELYHLQGPLKANNGAAPSYAQISIYDPQYGSEIRCDQDPKLVPRIVDVLTNLLYQVCF